MYSMDTGYTQYINLDNRIVRLTVKINGTQVSGTYIVSAEFTESVSDDNIAMGATCAKALTLKVRDNIGVSLTGAVINITMQMGKSTGTNGITGTSEAYSKECPMGSWIVSETKKSNGVITITAYDKMAYLTDNYEPTITFPATCKEVLEDIKTQYSISTNNTTFYKKINTTDKLITKAISCTVREMIGYIAGLNGCNAVFNRNGYLDFRFYSKVSVSLDKQIYADSNTEENETYTITALVSGEGENEITSGSGKAITFANPYMTQEILDGLVSSKLPITYSSGKVKYKGNPCLEAGDIITVYKTDGTTISLPIMQHKLTYTGGMYGNIEAYGKSENGDTISNYKSEAATIAHKITDVEEVQNNILGAKGGYYELLLDANDSNRPYGTAWWKDQEKTQGWKFTYGGLGFFQNDGLKNIGLDNTGNVIATNIAADSILTNSFKIGKSDSDYAMAFDGSTGKINFGGGVSMSWADITDTPTIPTSTSQLTNDSGYITNANIPSKTSQLTNDSGYINSSTATTITNNAISTATISASQVSAGSFYMTGGSISIDTGYDDSSIIRLTGSSCYSEMGTTGFYTAYTNGTYRAFVDAQAGFYVGDGSGTYSQLTLDGITLSGHGFYVNGDNFMSATNIEPEGSFNWDLGSDSYYWDDVFCYSVSQISDRNFKEDITPLADKYVDLFDKLNPVSFKFKGGNRTHTGFIAQDIETAMTEAGVSDTEFAGFYKNSDDVCGLRYTEFIALLTAKIKQQEKIINDLSTRVAALEEKQ